MPRGRRSRDRGYISGNRIISAPTYDEALVNYLVVAGGGGGGAAEGGGGGAGGLRSTVTTSGGGGALEAPLTLITSSTYSIVVGAGGVSGAINSGGFGQNPGGNGGNSVFSTITSIGGGGGGAGDQGPSGSNVGRTGGSGGGGNRYSSAAGGTGTTNQGFAGGAGAAGVRGGGGGGASAAGQSSAAGSAGGAGVATSITGSSVTYAGGGGGGAGAGAAGAGTGGSGGGGTASNSETIATAGTANLGGGGGGGGGGGTYGGPGGAGGSGVVILSYSNLYTLNIGAGLSYSTQVLNNDKITTFTGGSGSISLALAPVTTGDYESIATVLVGSGGASTVTFSNIPQTYKHLQIRCIARTSRVASPSQDALKIQFNSDTAANYSHHYLLGIGSSASSSGTANRVAMFADGFTSSDVPYFGVGTIDILDYVDTNKYKTIRCLSGWDSNGAGRIWFESGNWRSTNAVTSIELTPNIGPNFNQYSHFALYGIKG